MQQDEYSSNWVVLLLLLCIIIAVVIILYSVHVYNMILVSGHELLYYMVYVFGCVSIACVCVYVCVHVCVSA